MNAGHCGASASELHNGLKMLLSFSKVKRDVANIIWRSSYCCIQPAPSREAGTPSPCFVLITTSNILYFVFWVDNLLALSTSHACLCGLAVAARAMLQQCHAHNVCVHPDVNVCMCVILHAQIIYGLVSLRNFSYIQALWRNFWSDDVASVTNQYRSTTNSVGLTREHD